MNEMTASQLWQATLGELELTISKANFTTWFKNTFISSFDDGKVVISVPNAFTKLYIEKKYHLAIQKTIQNILNSHIKEVHYKVDTKPAEAQPTNLIIANKAAGQPVHEQIRPIRDSVQVDGIDEYGLRRSYTFENFIVGKGNELAHAAGQAVAEHPGTKYNPFFIYGGVGLGKTHLLQAIGHRIVEKNPQARVLYVTCEQFINEYINAVRGGHAKDFKDRYRTVDLLMVDDFQFITGKEGTQEEFFHTFNALYQGNKQVVFTADRPPKAIGTLEERLRSRLEWGMSADISSPDLETRIAILSAKCQEKRCQLSRDVLATVADAVQTNVRELEGALNKVIAYHELKNIPPTIESVKEILSDFSAKQAKKSVTPKELVQVVSTYFDISLDDMLGKSREKKLAFPRQIAMFLMRTELKSSFPTIGDELGGRDHTTAMHACDKISKAIDSDTKLASDLEVLKNRIYGNEPAW